MAKQQATISRAKWDAMTDGDRALLASIGISPAKPKTPTAADIKPKLGKLKPYVLGMIIDCKLCNEQTIELYNMVTEKGNGTYLVAVRTSPEIVLPNRWSVQKVPTCRMCPNSLRARRKEDLIKMLIQVASCGRVISDTLLPTYQYKGIEELPNVPDDAE